MTKTCPRRFCIPTLLFLCCCGWGSPSGAQRTIAADPRNDQDGEPVKVDGWIEEKDEETSITVKTMEMTLYPKAEPRPALKYRLIPDEFELLDGNAAIYYLKAMGFLEQQHAFEALLQFEREAAARHAKQGKDGYVGRPPTVWRSMVPSELPLDDVKEYLRLTSFQVPLLREAARRERFDMDRNLRDVDNPLTYLLADIQTMRQLARMHALRCRVAIGEGRIEDAIAILGQLHAMARHLGQDEFVVSSLVGIACAGSAWTPALHLVQHPDAPNLYWAFASLPRPLVDMDHAMAIERQFFYLQMKALRDVDEAPRPAGYWSDFLDRLRPQLENVVAARHQPTRILMVAYIAASYPAARDYLINECGLSRKHIAALPTAQVVFLAAVRFHEYWRDETFKWMHLPYWQARSVPARREVGQAMHHAAREAGYWAERAIELLPPNQAAAGAQVRCDQQIALIQTVEAIRMYGAAHDGELPPSLADLPVPAPLDPVTGQAFEYQYLDDHAALSCSVPPALDLRYQLILKFAEEDN